MNENYPIVVKTYNLTLWYTQKLGTLPKNHRFTIGEKIQNTLLDLLLHLSDAIYTKRVVDFSQNSLEVMALASPKAGAKAPVPSFGRSLVLQIKSSYVIINQK
ncbi:MAG: hypothetical protein U9N49_12735 [Campylobacterota bacterium]|nr:hypothetical protein [Campylobacterota bacterium]